MSASNLILSLGGPRLISRLHSNCAKCHRRTWAYSLISQSSVKAGTYHYTSSRQSIAEAKMINSLFQSKSPGIMIKLMSDFDLDVDASAAVLGNLGHESGGFLLMQEQKPLKGGRGGYGWAQWTGPRRRQFEQWAHEHNLPLDFGRSQLWLPEARIELERSQSHRRTSRDLNARGRRAGLRAKLRAGRRQALRQPRPLCASRKGRLFADTPQRKWLRTRC